MKKMWTLAGLAVAFAAGFGVHALLPFEPVVQAQQAGRFYELRTFTANEGKLEALHDRFRQHTMLQMSRMPRAHLRTRSPSGVNPTKRCPRSTIGTPSSCSSCRIRPDSVGWVTRHAWAARVKCFSCASATRYWSCRMSMNYVEEAEVLPRNLKRKR